MACSTRPPTPPRRGPRSVLHDQDGALGPTGTVQKLLPQLGVGQGLWRIRDRSFVCQHQLHPDELALFDTTGRMVGSRHALDDL